MQHCTHSVSTGHKHSNYKTLDEAIKSCNLITVFLISQYSTVILVLLHLFVYSSENTVGQDFQQMGETAGSTHSILLLLTVLLHVFSYCGPCWCSLSKTKHMGYSFRRHNKKCEDAVLALWNTLNMLQLLLMKALPAGSCFPFGLASACSVDIFKRSLQL